MRRILMDNVSSVVVPLVIYLAVAVVAPLLNGAAARAEFAGHAITVVGIGTGAIAVAWLVGALLRQIGRK